MLELHLSVAVYVGGPLQLPSSCSTQLKGHGLLKSRSFSLLLLLLLLLLLQVQDTLQRFSNARLRLLLPLYSFRFNSFSQGPLYVGGAVHTPELCCF